MNSVVPGPVMTGRRRSFMEKWAPAHGMSLEEAMKAFPAEAGISRYSIPEEIAELMAFLVSPAAKWLTGTCHQKTLPRKGICAEAVGSILLATSVSLLNTENVISS